MADSTFNPSGEVFLDARRDGKSLRLTWHQQNDEVTMSLWRSGVCSATFRLARHEVPSFIDALVDGLSGVREPLPSTPATRLPGQTAASG